MRQSHFKSIGVIEPILVPSNLFQNHAEQSAESYKSPTAGRNNHFALTLGLHPNRPSIVLTIPKPLWPLHKVRSCNFALDKER